MAFTLSTHSLTYTNHIALYHLHIVVSVAVTLGYLFRKAIAGYRVASWLSIAFGILAVGTANDLMVALQIIDSIYLGPFAFIAFVLMQSGILSGQAAHAHRKAEHLGQHLKREVEEQTEDLHYRTLEAQQATREALRQKAKAESARLDSLALKEEAERYAE